MQCVTLLFCLMVASAEDYNNKLTKLWSMSSASRDGASVFNVTSASIVIQPSNYANQQSSRQAKLHHPYAFKPRAIPIPIRREEPQVEKNVYYADDAKKYKSEILFPGNYYSISKEKSNGTYEKFRPQMIPLIRNDEFQARSLGMSEKPIVEEGRGFLEPNAQRRSIGEIFGVEDDDEDDEEGEYEIEELEDGEKKSKGGIKNKRKTKLKPKKLKKYMLPLLLAYKLKYFALVPVMIGGLVLLVGATGMAGFFFALFAAVMGLQKGGY